MALAPNRTDWRWELACKASEFSDSQAVYMLNSADEATRRAYLFKRAVDSNLDGSRWEDIEAAHELWSNRAAERLFIEGLLLGEQSYALIAQEVGASAADIEAYHDLFFDVTDKLKKPGWLVARLFQGGLYAPVSSRDRVGIMHRLAWLTGPEIFRAYYTGRYDISVQETLGLRLRDMLAKQSLLSAMCIGGRGDLDIEVIRVFVDDAKRQAAEVIGGGSDKETAAAVMGFLTSMSMTVADPKAPANLNLPAREPRAAEFHAHAEGLAK